MFNNECLKDTQYTLWYMQTHNIESTLSYIFYILSQRKPHLFTNECPEGTLYMETHRI